MRLVASAALLISVLLGLMCPGRTSASEKSDHAPLLVRQLGDSSFAVREAAHKELMQIGVAALPALHEGLKSNDLEVKRRCKELIPTIEKAEWARKADAYEMDIKGEQKHPLPLQKEYEKLIGKGASARKLFAEIVRRNGKFLQRMADAKGCRKKVYEMKCKELFPVLKDRQELDAALENVGKFCHADLAALFLVAVLYKVDQPVEWNDSNHVADLLGNPGVGEAVKNRKIGKAFSRLLVAWAQCQLSVRRSGIWSINIVGYFFYFVYKEKYTDGLVIVRKVIHRKAHHRPWPSFSAIGVAVLAKVLGKDGVEELEKIRKDQSVLFHTPGKAPVEIRLGDQALGELILLAGANPKDFGMDEFPGYVVTPPGVEPGWDIPLYGFRSDKDRRRALRKWEREKRRKERKAR